MKIKILWGFVGNGALLGASSNKIKAGESFEDADDEYAYTLIGKGLAVEVDANGKPRVAKRRKPSLPRPRKTRQLPRKPQLRRLQRKKRQLKRKPPTRLLPRKPQPRSSKCSTWPP